MERCIFFLCRSVDIAIARVAERVKQGWHNIPENIIRHRFATGLQNFEQQYKHSENTWVKYDNSGKLPVTLEWGENK